MLELVHVNKIEIADASEISSMTIIQPDKCRLKSEPTFESICVKDLVGIKIEDDYDNNQKIFKTEVSFITHERDLMETKRKCFRVTTVAGKRYIIGTSERPFPIIKEENNFPEKATDSTLKQVTITWKALYPMLQILE